MKKAISIKNTGTNSTIAVTPEEENEKDSGNKCGECLHHKRVAKFEKVCSQIGVGPFRKAPRCYAPNPYILNTVDPDALMKFGLFLLSLNGKQARVVTALLKKKDKMQKNYGLLFGQPVWFTIGADYLSNYFVGIVVDCSSVGDSQVTVTSSLRDKQRKSAMQAVLLRESIYTSSEFKKKKAKLILDGRLTDPKPMFSSTIKKVDESYVPPTIESAPAEWFNKVDKKKPASKSRLKQIDGNLVYQIKMRK